MATYRVTCRLMRTIELYVEADSEDDVYAVTVDDEDFDPVVYPCRVDDEEWADDDPVTVDEVNDDNAELLVDGFELVIK